MADVALGTITIDRFLDVETGITIGVTWDKEDDLSLVTALGMLELAKDTILREAMGEV